MIRSVWQSFWGELNTPSSFHDDPVGAVENQVGHISQGAFITAAICLIYGAWFGEMPYRWPTWVGVALGYLVLIEWVKQGWKGADSLADGGFFVLGSATVLVAFKELPHDSKVVLELQIGPGLAALAAIVIALAAYVYPRAVMKWRARP